MMIRGTSHNRDETHTDNTSSKCQKNLRGCQDPVIVLEDECYYSFNTFLSSKKVNFFIF